MDNIRDIVKELAKDNSSELYSRIGTVLSVDSELGTVDVEPIDGAADILGARLSPDLQTMTGIIQIPKVGSLVIVTFLSPVRAFISLVTEPEEIIINGGGHKGLIIWDKLKAQLDANSSILQSLISTLTSTPITEPGNGAPSALQAKLSAALAGQSPGSFTEDILNDKIKHG